MRAIHMALAGFGMLALCTAPSLQAEGLTASERPSLREGFPIGDRKAAPCQAQSRPTDPAMAGMFDQAWTIVCRDAALPIGRLYALRDLDGDPADRLAASRGEAVACSAPGSEPMAGLGTTDSLNCRAASGLPYRILRVKRGRYTYIAQGFASYQNALALGLRSIATDEVATGEVEVAVLGVRDSAAFARMQARALDPDTTLAEGYRRNASGDYAEAAEYFDSLQDRLASDPEISAALSPAQREARRHEYLVNRALQLSNLGEFRQADRLFAEAMASSTSDPVQLRLRRNFRVMNKLNEGDYPAALAILDLPLAPMEAEIRNADGSVDLSGDMAAQLSRTLSEDRAMAMVQSTSLTPLERARIIDAQALQLRGTALRLSGAPSAEALAPLERARTDALAVRGGRVNSTVRLRAQILAEIALVHEKAGDPGRAEGLLREAVNLLATQYPETTAMNGARARLGAFLIRRGRDADALALYRQIVASTGETHGTLTGLYNQLGPYFDLLARDIPGRPELVDDLFLASQLLVRPGAAETMEILNRALASGTNEGARLFRESVSLGRDVERARIRIAQLSLGGGDDAAKRAAIADEQARMASLARQQAEALTQLAGYSQFRAVARDPLTLADLRAALKPGEAYMKLAVVGDAVYAIYADAAGATGYRLPVSTAQMGDKVQALRDTISITEQGVRNTYPFDLATARALYLDLFSPVDARLRNATHLIFEPDGAMLKLPANLLVADQAGVDAYAARLKAPGGDEFDFRGVGWLGRDRGVSTSLSARAFADARAASPSPAAREYLGFGDNKPVGAATLAASTRAVRGGQAPGCEWPADEWNRPISPAELRTAAALTGEGASSVVTGAAFSDDRIMARPDMDQYRILHFATHGLVTAPRRGCPARPALLTSFGGPRSDGLLQFDEIFDLRLNADLVILSACDTAGQASREATRAAGLERGGGTALDGLVRAFIGAGSRAVIASHWPAPDEFQATQRLIAGLFQAPPGTGIGDALRTAQRRLMDSADTSHPFYWSGFAIVGDGARPMLLDR